MKRLLLHAMSCIAALGAALFATATAAQTGGQAVDWKKQQAETLRHHRALIQIDSSSPPGNETKVDEYLTHRAARESAILAALQEAKKAKVEQIVEAVYVDVPEILHPVARFSVWAHLRKLAGAAKLKVA